MANYLTIRIRLLIAILASVFPLSTMKAEEGKDVLIPSQGWYVGIEGGMHFAIKPRQQTYFQNGSKLTNFLKYRK